MPCQPVTATLGSPYSQPGAIQPGYFCTGTVVWRGPWSMTFATGPVMADNAVHVVGEHIRIGLATASQMARSDPGWYEFH